MKEFLRTFYWWRRLINHLSFRFDDYHVWHNFWFNLNLGYYDMHYEWEYKNTWGKPQN